MANPNRLLKGNLLWVWAEVTTSPETKVWQPIACTTSKSLSTTTEDVDLTSDCDQGSFGSSAAGTRGWTIDVSAFATRIMGTGSQTNWNQVFRMWKSGNIHNFRIAPAPSVDMDDNEFFLEGPGRVSEFTLTAETTEYTTFDFTITGTGELIDEPAPEV